MHPPAATCAALHVLALTLPSHVAGRWRSADQHANSAPTCTVRWKIYLRRRLARGARSRPPQLRGALGAPFSRARLGL